jgi:hypothetical protein
VEVHAALFIINTLAGFTETKYFISPLIKTQISLKTETKSNFSKSKYKIVVPPWKEGGRRLSCPGKHTENVWFGKQKKKSAVLLTMTQFLFLAHSSLKGGPLGGEESSTLCQ